MSNEKDGKDLHKGHRKRMTDRFLKTGLEGFQPHEILEMLLFYSIPRSNTNPIAHDLLRKFGTVTEVLKASPESLRQVKGVSDRTIAMQQFFRELALYTQTETAEPVSLGSAAAACEYFRRIYQFEGDEVIRAALLDDRLKLRRCIVVAKGMHSVAELPVRAFTKLLLAEKCSTVILAHNHPNGAAVPSPEDISATDQLMHTLIKFEIQLADHVIVGMDGTISMRDLGLLAELNL